MHESKGVPGGRMPKITNSYLPIVHLMMARWFLAETGIQIVPVVETPQRNHNEYKVILM